MVIRKNLESNALISVYDKSNLNIICKVLNKYNINIISSGSTAKKINSLGYKCKEVSKLTKFREILDGRVKTLHPKIYSSILFERDNLKHQKTFKDLNFPKIDYVIVNFYPFTKILKNKNIDKIIEMIDIGGPSIIRSASKNFKFITAISSTKYYGSFIKELEKNNGKTKISFRKKMAEQNFKSTSDYDSAIHNWLDSKNEKIDDYNKINIKYGENPNQKAYFLKKNKFNIFNCQISGKAIGYNNILDISEGLDCLREFKDPTCVIIKHNNPCGVASNISIEKSYEKALGADPISAFGGVVLFNKKINIRLAKKISQKFYEIVVAPKFDKGAYNILKSKENLIIIDSHNLKKNKGMSFKSVDTGVLYQEKNITQNLKSSLKLVSNKNSSKKTIDDLIFAFKVAKHVKSNAVVLVKNKQTIGIGAGQMSRLDATRLAIMKRNDFFKNKKFVCASDAFFPFTDNIKILKKNNCIAIIQPGGSKNDIKIIDYAKKNKISLYFVKNRVFKH